MVQGRERIQKAGVILRDSGHLGLLQHDLGNQNPIGVTGAAPG